MNSAPSHDIALLCNDLFFCSQIEGTAQANGAKAKSVDDVAAALKLIDPAGTKLVIVDLDTRDVDCSQLMAGLPQPRPRVIGFFPHLRIEVRDAALAAGFDAVLTRGQFSAQLVELCRQVATK